MLRLLSLLVALFVLCCSTVEGIVYNPPIALGCFLDGSPGPRILPTLLYQGSGVTKQFCFGLCTTANAPLCGINNGKECWAGNGPADLYSQTLESNCGVKCNGDGSKGCGGYSLVSVYKMNDMAITAPQTLVWRKIAPNMPKKLFETTQLYSAATNEMFVLGWGQSDNDTALTYTFNFQTNKWKTTDKPRPFPLGHHIASILINGKWYCIGGTVDSYGKVQIYDIASDTWTLGADMPYQAGSVSAAYIGGLIYVCGGATPGKTSATKCAKYNPATNQWGSTSEIPQMPLVRQHAAYGTDGNKLFIFGGRIEPHTGSDGNNDTLVYDPVTNKWDCSCFPGSSLRPLPQRRGATGHAPYYNGKFYIFGGETRTDLAAAGGDYVYERVDIYDVQTNTWSRGPDMLTGLHGIYPVLITRPGERPYIRIAGGSHAKAHQWTNFQQDLFLV